MSTQCIKERPLSRFGHRTGLDTEQLLLLEREVETRIGSNRQVNQRRWGVEQGISHLRSWKVLTTGYRRPLPKADRTLQTVIKLQMYRHHSEAAFA